MSYLERIRQMKFIAPGGSEHIAQFSKLERTGGKKVPVTEFPGQDQGSVQNLGNVTPTWPVTCWISGDDYDIDANEFWAALHEDGIGTLEHPVWGNWQVLAVPQSEKRGFVEGMGRATFSVTFIRVSEEQFQYPDSVPDTASLASSAADSATSQVASEAEIDLDENEKKGLAALAETVVEAVSETFGTIANLTDDVKSSIDQAVRDIIDNIDTLVESPAELMQSVLELYRFPAKVETAVQQKIAAYGQLYTSLIDGFISTTAEYGESLRILSSGSIAGILVAANEASQYGTFKTRNQTADSIDALFSLNQDAEDLGNSYELQKAIKESTAIAFNGLVAQSLDLPSEKTYITKGDICPINLVYQLYGDTSRLDEFLEYNDIGDSYLFIIPRGTEVRYYA